jgi:proteasome accessory factor C
MTAATRFARLLRLLPHVADGQSRLVADVARQLRVPAAQLREDLHSIAERVEDTSGAFIEGVQVLLSRDEVRVHSRWFQRPLGLGPDESAAVALGLAVLEQEGPADTVPVLRSAREKVTRLSPAMTKPKRSVGPAVPRAAASGAPRETRFLAALQRAWVARRDVVLRYRKPSARAPEERTVRPWRLISARGAWFLVGEDAARTERRIFRLDRIESVRIGTGTYEIPAGFTVDDVLRDGTVFASAGAGTLVVRYGADIARWIAERERGVTEADGSVTVEYPLADDAWAVRHVLRYGPDAVVVSPPRVRELVRSVLARLA